MFLDNKHIILLSTGSFNPITNMHLRMFEVARDHMNRLGYKICGGWMSPTHDEYNKKGLVSSTHRCAMIKQALVALPWVKMSDWEAKQSGWSRTMQVLQYHQNHLNMMITSRLNGDDKVDSSIVPEQFFENIDTTNLSQSTAINVKLLCGADLLESFAVPGLWNEEDIETILRDYGLVVVSRSGYNPQKFIYESDMLTKYMANILIVTEWISNEISSTKIRRALYRNESVKFLISDLVESYIKENGLYGTQNNKCTDKSDVKMNMVSLSSSLSSKTLKFHQIDDNNTNIDESNNIQYSNKREKKCNKSKVRHLIKSKENCSWVAIKVSKNGIIEVKSDKETMV